jgi:hypothetical protein
MTMKIIVEYSEVQVAVMEYLVRRKLAPPDVSVQLWTKPQPYPSKGVDIWAEAIYQAVKMPPPDDEPEVKSDLERLGTDGIG